MNDPSAKRSKISPAFIVAAVGLVGCGVVGIVGILAAIAIPSFVSYIRRSKTAEARVNVRALAVAVEEHCGSKEAAPLAAGPLPLTPTAKKQFPAFTADPGFSALGFAPTEGVYYRYTVRTTGSSVEVRAEGDLDGDSTLSSYSVSCVLASEHDARCACDTTIRVVDELE